MQHLDWTATLNTMRESIPRAQYLSYIEPLKYITRDETSVRLGVPSQFHEEALRGHLKQHLIKAIESQTGKAVQLEFEVLAKTPLNDSQPSLPIQQEPTVTNIRPTLRVIEGALSSSIDPADIPEVEQVVFRAQYPKFSTKFFPIAYNRVAHQACLLFVEGKDPNLNALMLTGNVGMGKTHLLSMIAEQIEATQPGTRIRYTNSESFTASMIQSFKENKAHEFKMLYREETDVLLFDDVHELQGRDKTQEQVLHLFNELLTLGKRIVFTSKIPVSRLTKMLDPLRSRLLSMVSVEITSPTSEDRLSLLTQVAESSHIIVDGQVLRHLSDNGSLDVRELVGSLLHLHIKSRLENKPIDAEYLHKIGSFQQTTRSSVSLEEIVSLVEMNFGVSRTELSSKGRKSNIAWPRQVAMYLARHMTYLPLEEIGRFFGKDHSTVLYSYEKVSEGIRTQRDIQLQIEYLLERLKTKAPKK